MTSTSGVLVIQAVKSFTGLVFTRSGLYPTQQRLELDQEATPTILGPWGSEDGSLQSAVSPREEEECICHPHSDD
jgi:hypothetical protein